MNPISDSSLNLPVTGSSAPTTPNAISRTVMHVPTTAGIPPTLVFPDFLGKFLRFGSAKSLYLNNPVFPDFNDSVAVILRPTPFNDCL